MWFLYPAAFCTGKLQGGPWNKGPVIRARFGWLIIWGFIPGDEALPVFSFVDRSEWMMFDTLNRRLVRWLFCSWVGLLTT